MSIIRKLTQEETTPARGVPPIKALHKEFPGQSGKQIERATEECRKILGMHVDEERFRECVENRLTAHTRYSG